MDRFWKGMIVGLGGVAPGLSGSVLLIIFGLYQKTLDALAGIVTHFQRNLRFLLPLVSGMVLGVLLFSRLIDYLLAFHEVPTRFCFLGLILGTLPMVWREVRKEGFSRHHYAVIAAAALLGAGFFARSTGAFPQVTDPSLLQCFALGTAVAATAIIPGVDPAVFLSTLGFYEMYVGALADLNFHILLPMVVGLSVGAIGISFLMSRLFRRFYTASYCVIFGIFLSMIPNMLTDQCVPDWSTGSMISGLLMVLGFLLSFYLGDFQKNNQRIQSLFRERG